MEFLQEYIIEQALIIIPVLIFIGWILKNTPKIKDWFIPYLLLILGIIFALALLGLHIDAVIQGVLVSGAAVFGHQLYAQAKHRE